MHSENLIVDIPFNIDLSGYMLPKNYIHIKLRKSFIASQTEEWIDRRLDLFMRLTANSLLHQTDQHFLCLLRCTENTESLIKEKLKAYPPLPSHFLFTTRAQELIDERMKKYGCLYRIVIDSDNMFHPEAITKIRNFLPKADTRSLLFQEGYAYNEATKEVIEVFHPSPSFYAALYDEVSYAQLYNKRLFEKHWDVTSYPYEVIGGKNYCICTHDKNVDNTFLKLSRKYMVRALDEAESRQFMIAWHLL